MITAEKPSLNPLTYESLWANWRSFRESDFQKGSSLYMALGERSLLKFRIGYWTGPRSNISRLNGVGFPISTGEVGIRRAEVVELETGPTVSEMIGFDLRFDVSFLQRVSIGKMLQGDGKYKITTGGNLDLSDQRPLESALSPEVGALSLTFDELAVDTRQGTLNDVSRKNPLGIASITDQWLGDQTVDFEFYPAPVFIKY